jgi:hypothetical protein
MPDSPLERKKSFRTLSNLVLSIIPIKEDPKIEIMEISDPFIYQRTGINDNPGLKFKMPETEKNVSKDVSKDDGGPEF